MNHEPRAMSMSHEPQTVDNPLIKKNHYYQFISFSLRALCAFRGSLWRVLLEQVVPTRQIDQHYVFASRVANSRTWNFAIWGLWDLGFWGLGFGKNPFCEQPGHSLRQSAVLVTNVSW